MIAMMKMLWLLVSTLALHQAVAMRIAYAPGEGLRETTQAIDSGKAKVVACNATAYCPDGNTCCRLPSGQWGCCPSPNAVCCSDRLHCCPHGYTCTSTSCSRGSDVTKLFKKKPAIQAQSVVCPDGESTCPDNDTCCKTADREWGCCPLPGAVCCKDGEHCCPKGYTCDVSAGTCSQKSKTAKILMTTPTIKESKAKDVPCSSTASCPDGNTCCRLASGQWGCCPLPNAVCCSDGVHCCPTGYTCDEGTCSRGSHITKLLKKKPAIQAKQVQCKDGSYCPDENTCCKLASGGWGCCPLPNAVCCSDGEHCCPHGYTCDEGKCSRGSDATKLFKKKPAIQAKDVPCSSTASCPDGNTCCKLASGEWGCCPLPNAVCCSDGVHCCPNGYTCDEGTCSRGSDVTKLFKKKPAIQDVPCSSTASCPDGNTCCRLASGEWGCCPLPNAVCCSDGVHCCPNGYTCDEATCSRGSDVTKLFEKKLAIQAKIVPCSSTAYCPDGNTCCRLASGDWGCCPLPNAVCCSDRVHCCPQGTTCTSSGQCQREFHVMRLSKKKLAIEVEQVICPDEQSQCPDGNTCCKLASGEWGCCPLPNAVCCSDGEHCCPHGYTCDVSAGTCSSGSDVTKLFKKKPAIQNKKAVEVK